MLAQFTPFRIELGDVSIAGRVGGAGPALLLLHGHPQSHLIWHRMADRLATRFRVVCADLRGYGASSKPAGLPDHANYSKRTMAADMLALMRHFGHDRFDVCAHDRGARVTHRLCMDAPDAVGRAVLLDIAPTLAMYEQTSRDFATAYFHWFFLIQPAPLPERLIGADPDAYIDAVMGRRTPQPSPFPPEVQQAYRAALRGPGAVHAMCEDYRASAGIDLEHDRADRDAQRRCRVPLRVLWGANGIVGRLFDPLREWRRVAEQVDGGEVPCGHYIPEEAPDAVLAAIDGFLGVAV